MRRLFTRGLPLVAASFLPLAASAHEVYVLSSSEIKSAVATSSFSEWHTVLANLNLFAFWAVIGAFVVFVVFFASISRTLERIADPVLAKLPSYAPVISRVTIGLSFLAAANFNALFGPELPLAATFGAGAPVVTALLVIIGALITVGLYTRLAAAAGVALFAVEAFSHGAYMFTYANYLGELIVLLILGAHGLGMRTKRDDARRARSFRRLRDTLAPLAFPVLRVCFGISLLYASVYAKIIHNDLALQVASLPLAGHATSIATLFGFEPHFLVLGAAIVEIVIATFFIIGFEIRFTSVFLLFWLSLSLWYFGEVVWPHLILIGIPIAFIFYGYDRYSFEGRFFKTRGREPVL